MQVREFEQSATALLHARPGSPSPRTQENRPFGIVNVDYGGNFSTYSPELLGLDSSRYGPFALGNVATDSLDAILASPRFARMEADIAEGVRMCRQSCRYFPFCGGGPPGNKHFENGTFASTETLFCRLHMKACLDVTADWLERHPPVAGDDATAVGANRDNDSRSPALSALPLVAPRFHLDADWPAVWLGAGWKTWRKVLPPRAVAAAHADELALLVPATPAGALPVLGENPAAPAQGRAPDDHICLFQIPEHLLAAWWSLIETGAESGGPIPGFDGFAAKVAEFLEFKRLGCSGAAQMEVLVTREGSRSIRIDPATGQPSGLGPTIAPWLSWPVAEQHVVPRLHAIVNLGDEETAVVFINLSPGGMATELSRRSEVARATVGELVASFLKACPDYPPTRLRLAPGEGCRLPTHGLILDGDATGKQEPDVLLLVSEDGPSAEDGV